MKRKPAEASGSSTKIVIRKDQMGARPANFARPRLPSSDSESEVDDGRLNSEELEDDAESEKSESDSYEEESPEVSEEEPEDEASQQEPESMLPLLSKRNRGLRSNLSSIEAQEVLHLHATGNKKKKRKQSLTEEEMLIKKNELDEKRRLHLLKIHEEKKTSAMEKILNEARKKGVKLQTKQQKPVVRPQRPYNPSAIEYVYRSSQQGDFLVFTRRKEFEATVAKPPASHACSTGCGKPAKYKMPKKEAFFCSPDCFKLLSLPTKQPSSRLFDKMNHEEQIDSISQTRDAIGKKELSLPLMQGYPIELTQ